MDSIQLKSILIAQKYLTAKQQQRNDRQLGFVFAIACAVLAYLVLWGV